MSEPATAADGLIEFGDIKFTPPHTMSLQDQAKMITKIQRTLVGLGTLVE